MTRFTVATIACIVVALLLCSTTAEASKLFGQIQCSDSTCKNDCKKYAFVEGQCYATTSGGSALSYCGSSTLKMQIFPFTTNCTAYNQEMVNQLDVCIRGSPYYVVYICDIVVSSQLNKNGGAADKMVLLSTSAKKEQQRPRRSVPMVIPSNMTLATVSTLAPSVGLLAGGNSMKINMNTPAFSALVESTLVDITISKVTLAATEQIDGTPAISITRVASLENVCGLGMLNCGAATATSATVRLDVVRMYVESVLATPGTSAVEVTFAIRGSALGLFTIRL